MKNSIASVLRTTIIRITIAVPMLIIMMKWFPHAHGLRTWAVCMIASIIILAIEETRDKGART